MKRIILAAAALLVLLMLTGCKKNIKTVDDLKDGTIGVQLGTVGEQYAWDITGHVECFLNGEDAVEALTEGVVDAVLIDVEPAKLYVEQYKGLKILDEPFSEEQFAFALKKDSLALKGNIDIALLNLEKNGTLEQICSNWIGEEKGKHPYVSPEDIDRSKGKLIIGTNAEFPPYEFMDGNELTGFDIDLIKAVCDSMNKEYEIVNMEFDDIIPAVESGSINIGAAAITITDDRLERVIFSEPYTTSSQVLIVRK